jgi:SAM-dependent methyltransferase
MDTDKQAVHDFWNAASCGESLYLQGTQHDDSYAAQARKRYELEPYIEPFADFSGTRGREVLEIGVGLGADHERFAAAGARLSGVDLTERAVEHTRHRLQARGLTSSLRMADAEALPYAATQVSISCTRGVFCTTHRTRRRRSTRCGVFCAQAAAPGS